MINNEQHKNEKAIDYLGTSISYKELFEKVYGCAKALHKTGCRKGDIVTIALPSIPEAVYSIYACSYLGLIANVIHPLASENEILNYLNEVNSKVFIMYDGTYDLVGKSLNKTSVHTNIVVSGVESCSDILKIAFKIKNGTHKRDNSVSWKSFIKNARNEEIEVSKVYASDPVVISHTGGTTGEPKGVVLTNKNFISEIWQIGNTMEGGRGTRMLTVLPPFVNYSLANCILEPLSLGLGIVLIPKYEPTKIYKYIKKYKPGHINSIPPYWGALINASETDNTDFSFLKNAFYGGEKMSEDEISLINTILKKGNSKVSLMSGYGMTELVSAATATYEDCCSSGSVGIPLVKTDCKIVDLVNDDEKTYEEEGEICFAGPTLMKGYYENLEATEKIIKVHSDGKRWLHTGDVGYIGKNGELYITGRIKRIFITKGDDGIATKMFPDRIEKALMSVDWIEECCVVEKADLERVNVAVAFVQLKKHTVFNKEEVYDILKNSLPSYMIPVDIIAISIIPRTSRGKVDYRSLKDRV